VSAVRNRILPLAGLLAVILVIGFAVNQATGGSDNGPQAQGPALARAQGATGNGEMESPTYNATTTGDDAQNTDSYSLDANVGLPPGVGGAAAGDTGAESTLTQPSVIDRQIIRTATVELTVDDVPGTLALIETAATGAGGFVAGSSLNVETVGSTPTEEDGEDEPEIRQTGTVSIRVPAENYASVMGKIRDLVANPEDIRSLTEDSSEVTEEYSDLQARLRNLEATETQYLDLLSRAATITDILQVQDRLNSTRLEIEQVQGRIQLLDDLTSMATITVNLALPPITVELTNQAPAQQSWSQEAWDDAWETSEDVMKGIGIAAITGAFVLVWLLVPGAFILGGWWIINARRTRGQAA
jgi:hypothetical protein